MNAKDKEAFVKRMAIMPNTIENTYIISTVVLWLKPADNSW